MAEFDTIKFHTTDDESSEPVDRVIEVGKTATSTITITDLFAEIDMLAEDLIAINTSRDLIIDRAKEIIAGLNLDIKIPAKKIIN